MDIVHADVEVYAQAHTKPEDELLTELAKETREKFERWMMQVGRVEGALLQMLVRLVAARRVIEIGMFTGFSALSMAAALPEGGELITCDIDPEAEATARRYFARSPHGSKIKVRMGPAADTLSTLRGPFDMAFIDADKGNYPVYYERCVDLLRPGGVIAIDNTLWHGRVLEPRDVDSRAIADLNARVTQDARVDNVLLTVRDGVMLARKRSP